MVVNSNLFTEFCLTTTEMIDKLISVALDLINPQHKKTGLLIAVIVPHNTGCNTTCNQNSWQYEVFLGEKSF